MLVSVIIPYFENKKFISKTINSVLNQSYKNLEIIIIFDEKMISIIILLKNFN